MGVTLKATHVVLPAEPTREGILPLSDLDQVGVISHTSVLYFYDRPSHEDWVDPLKNKVINTLKDSLSRVLVPFYPLAGRLSWIEGSRLELDCKAMGAELIEAESTDNISDFGDFVESSTSMFRDLIPHIDYANSPIQQLPLLCVQATAFGCGGICVAIHFSHVLMDGRSLFHFIKEWGRFARGEPLEVAPYMDRLALKYKPAKVDPLVSFSQVVDDGDDDDDALNEKTQRLSPTFVLLTGDRIEILKKVANRDHVAETHCRKYSRFEVITAHLWRCMTLARELDPHQMMTLYVIADARSRLDPPLPSSYFGNAIIPVTARSRAGELLSMPLSYACSKVREAVEQMSSEYIKGTIESLGKEENLSKLQYMEDRGDLVGNSAQSSPDMWVTSSLNLLAQGLDFGWGKEVYAGPPTGLSDYRNTLVLPHYRWDGSVKLATWLQANDNSSKFIDFCIHGDAE
ncbi:spermidine hydroxycinnamoyl transferase-like [Silene latifolia]|uniref:spermidine hydroxycinnamoyl transferase-like n=1 Tax=Silene latifolia TaxID=37657 RepID=UPI003D77933E